MADPYIQSMLDRINSQPVEAIVERLHRYLDRLPGVLKRMHPDLRAKALGGLEESMDFWINVITKDAPSPEPARVIDFQERLNRQGKEGA